jgi:anti-sigma regulatory factor (Ser/Thr protein kinase)
LKLSHESELTWLRLPGRPESLGRFQAFALACAQAQTATESLHTKIDLVLEEVLLNIFYYAFEEGSAGIVAVGCGMTQDKKFLVRVVDPGRPFDPLQKPPPDITLDIAERDVGGLGILLARKISSAMIYDRKDDHNVLDIYFDQS